MLEKSKKPEAASVFALKIRGRTIPLALGTKLTTSDIPVLKTERADKVLAEVSPNPSDPAILGLKNLSQSPWTIALARGDRKIVEPGHTIRIEDGLQIHFGDVLGVVQRRATATASRRGWLVAGGLLAASVTIVAILNLRRDAGPVPLNGNPAKFVHVPPLVRPVADDQIDRDPATGQLVVRNEVLVRLSPGMTADDLRQELARTNMQGKVVGTIPDFGIAQIDTAGSDPQTAIANLSKLTAVAGSYLNGFQYPLYQVNDPDLTDPRKAWGLSALGLAAAWEVTRGSGVKVAVIDTGCDPQHPDLIDRTDSGYSFETQGPQQIDVRQREEAWHGTHVAGTIAATANNDIGTAGVAPEARIIPLQVILPRRDAGGNVHFTAADSDVIAAISWAMGQGAQVINLSLGPHPTEAQTQALDDPGQHEVAVREFLANRDRTQPLFDNVLRTAASHDVICVVAAGNGDHRGAALPANWFALPNSPWTIGVAAVDAQGNAAEFSNYEDPAFNKTGHRAVTICAPGVDIWSCKPGGDGIALSGTSMAAPHVAGTVALLKAIKPTATFDEIRDVLVSTGRPIRNPGSHDVGPVVDAAAAVAEMQRRIALQQQPPQPQPQPQPEPPGPIEPPKPEPSGPPEPPKGPMPELPPSPPKGPFPDLPPSPQKGAVPELPPSPPKGEFPNASRIPNERLVGTSKV